MRQWLFYFNDRKSHLVSFYCSNNSGAIDVKVDIFLSLAKNYISRCWDFLLLSWIVGFTLPVLWKVHLGKLEPLCILGDFSSQVVYFYCKSIIQPCMKYCRHDWADVSYSYLDMLHDKLQGQLRKAAGSNLLLFLNLGISSKCSQH